MRSYGSNQYEASLFTVNNYTLFIDQLGPKAGLSMLKVKRATGDILQYMNFKMNSGTSSDSVLTFLNTFDSTQYLLALNASYVPGGQGFNAATRAKMREFGSVYADSIPIFGYFHTWSFAGYLGAPPSQVSEEYHPCCPNGWIPSVSNLSPAFTSPSGTITQNFGPAQSWKNFSWEQTLSPNSSIKFDVYGINRNGGEQLLLPNVTTNNNVDLQSINAYQYPNLKLVAKLGIDSVNGFYTPVFKSLRFSYVPASDLALDINSTIKSDSIVSAGDSIGFGIRYYNVGFVNVNGVVRSFYAYNQYGSRVLLGADTVSAPLMVDSSGFIKSSFRVDGMPIFKKYNNQINFNFEVTPLAQQNELYYYNNDITSNFFVKGAPVALGLEVFSDGVKLFGGDYIRSKPDIFVRIQNTNKNTFVTVDTSFVKVFINNRYLPFNINQQGNQSQRIMFESSRDILTLKFIPELKEGQNEMKFVAYSTNNISDTLNFLVNVSYDLMIKDVFNYPNPMRTETMFTFNLAGDKIPAGCKIKIYTVSGRIAKILDVPANIGFNQIMWDGRDDDGDYMANGVYFYRIIIEGQNEKETAIQKLVILR